jgi:UDP-N-acetylglucosamine--N-acetylmuramyl-(pentapeptide) pyrophosphoryl-undecaprenol N-acetylglucosamine transferase
MNAHNAAPKILLMAGGTGGHIFPALAVAEALTEQGWQTHWLGSENGMEVTLIPKYNIDLSLLSIAGVRGKSLLTRLISPLYILKAVWQAIKVIKKYRPDVVLGMGGFASGPGGLAAWLLQKPLCIHEQNAVPGITNRILSKFSKYSLQAFPDAIVKADSVTGNPIRSSICNIAAPEERFAELKGDTRILIIGGSRGAAIFNQIMPEVIAQLPETTTLNIWHQTGSGKRGLVQQRYSEQKANYPLMERNIIKVDNFIDDIDSAYQWADLVICRAGALTVSELAVVGLGAIFIPFPHAVDDHQTANAEYLVKAGGAEIIQQNEMSVDILTKKIIKLANREHCLKMAINARKQGKPDATQKVAEFCIQAVMNDKPRKAA